MIDCRSTVGLLLISGAISAYAATPQQEAFAQAHVLAESAQPGAAANVAGGGVESTVNQFNPAYYNSNGTAPESALFQNGNGDTVSAGQAKTADCQSATPNPDLFLRQNCEAINLMVRNPTVRPQIAIPPSLLAPSKTIVANAPALANSSLGITNSDALGTFSGCVNKTVTAPPKTELCNEFTGSASQQCTVGQVLLVDQFTHYMCDKTNTDYLPQSCDKTLTATVTSTNYCTVSGSAIGIGSYSHTTTTSKYVRNAQGKRVLVRTQSTTLVSYPHYDVVFACSTGGFATVSVTINAAAQCHSYGCNSDYFPITLSFTPGNDAGPVTTYMARVYTGIFWEYATVSYSGATNTLTIIENRAPDPGDTQVTASASPTGSAGINNVITPSINNGCIVQEAAAL